MSICWGFGHVPRTSLVRMAMVGFGKGPGNLLSTRIHLGAGFKVRFPDIIGSQIGVSWAGLDRAETDSGSARP